MVYLRKQKFINLNFYIPSMQPGDLKIKYDQFSSLLKRQITSSSSYLLEVSNFSFENSEYTREITNAQIIRYANRIVIYITDKV